MKKMRLRKKFLYTFRSEWQKRVVQMVPIAASLTFNLHQGMRLDLFAAAIYFSSCESNSADSTPITVYVAASFLTLSKPLPYRCFSCALDTVVAISL